IESFSTNVDSINENIPIPFTLEEVNLILRSDCNLDLVLKERNVIKNLDNIKSLKGIPIYLLYEYLINLHVWLSIQHKQPSIHVDSFINICKTKLNSKLMPTSQAPGGGSDGFIETNNKNILIETTTLKHFSALIKNEVEPIKRHAFSVWEKNSKETIVLFFTKYLHKSLLQYLYFAFDNLKEFSKTQRTLLSTDYLIFIKIIFIISIINCI
uniref:AlwI family type II restriction endonuclease n=1 Tax=Mesomycoplasma ovipneumoniae TaxID=29562 RepID=UPI00307FE68A